MANELARWNISPAAEAAFRKAGWTPGRRIDVAEILAKLAKLGFRISEQAIRIHESFSGLQVQTPRGRLNFSVLWPSEAQDEAIQFWESQLRTRMSPIFEHSQDVLSLLADDGRVFGIQQPCFLDIADSFGEAINLYFQTGKQIEQFASMLDAFRIHEDIGSMLDDMAKDPKRGFRKLKDTGNS